MEFGVLDPRSQVPKAWEYIIESWERQYVNHDLVVERLFKEIEKEGWTVHKIRQWAEITRPYLVIRRPLFSRVKPPEPESTENIFQLIKLDVHYPERVFDNALPSAAENLTLIVREYRKNLEYAALLEAECGTNF